MRNDQVLLTRPLAAFLQIDETEMQDYALTLEEPLRLRKRGVESRIIIGEFKPDPNVKLQKLLGKAMGWAGKVKLHGSRPVVSPRGQASLVQYLPYLDFQCNV